MPKNMKKTTKKAVKNTPKKVAAKKQIIKVKREEAPVALTPEVNQELKEKLQKWNQKLFRVAIVVAIVAGLAYLVRNVLFVALVNGQPISRIAIIKQLEKTQGKTVLDQLINETIIAQQARKKDIEVNQTTIDEAIKEIEESVASQGQDLDSLLTLQGMTRKDLEKQIRIQKTVEALLTDKTAVTEEDVAAYLETNKDFLPEDKTEEELKEMAKEQLEQQKMSQAFQTWLQEVKAEAKIHYLREY